MTKLSLQPAVLQKNFYYTFKYRICKTFDIEDFIDLLLHDNLYNWKFVTYITWDLKLGIIPIRNSLNCE